MGILEERMLLDAGGLANAVGLNGTIAGVQRAWSKSDHTLAVDLDGNAIAVWSTPSAGGHGSSVIARRVDRLGNPLTPELVVNTTTTGLNRNPVVAASVGNTFVVAWEGSRNPLDGGGWGVFARVYSAEGKPLTGEILINQTRRGNQQDPSVAWLTPDSFVVVWSGAGQGRNRSVFGRTFDASGVATSGETRLSGYLGAGDQWAPVVAALPAGGFQAAWRGAGATDSLGVYSRRFDAAANPLGFAFRVNTALGATEQNPAIAVVGSEVIIAWQSLGDGLDRSATGVIARRFDLEGKALGPEFRLNQTTTGYQHDPSLSALADGGFVAAWQGAGKGDNQGIFVREFNADGTPRGPEQLATVSAAGDQTNPSVQALGDGYLLMWDGMVRAGSAAKNSVYDRRGIGFRGMEEARWDMPGSSVSKRDDVMTFTIPNIGVVNQVSPKTITFTNTTSRTVYPILESANNNVVTNDTYGHKGLGLYDPYDPVNLEYRGYIGYQEKGHYYLGVRPGETVQVLVPLVFWDAGRILIASDGENLIPKVDNVVSDPTNPNSPNPFHYHAYQNFVINAQVQQDLVNKDKVPQDVVDKLNGLLNQVFTEITAFEGAVLSAIGEQANIQYQRFILNRAGAVIETKRYRDDLSDGVHAVLWYRAQSVGGLALGPASGAPAQLAEMTFRSKIFASSNYLTHLDIDPNGTSGEVHDLVNYDVSYVDSMTLPVAMQANNVPLDPSGQATQATAPYGWVGADKTFGDLQSALRVFTTANPNPSTNLNGLGNYFGGAGYPKYYIPSAVEAESGIKVPAGQNLALESPITNGRSDWDQNRFILTSAGSDPLVYASPGAVKSLGNTVYFAANFLQDLTTVQQAIQAGKTVLINPSLNNYPANTRVTGVTLTPDSDGYLAVTLDKSDINANGTPGGVYDFTRPIVDKVMTTLANLWFSWADHYYQAVKNIVPAASYAGSIAKDTNALVLTTPVPAGSLVVGMPVAGSGMPQNYQATILGFTYTDATKTMIQSVLLSKLSDAGGSGTDYTIGQVQQIRPQNSVGFPIQAYDIGVTNPSDPTYDVRFARAVYLVMDSMNTIPVSGPTAPAIITLMANVLGGNIGFIPHIGVSSTPSGTGYGGVNLVADVIRDNLKSVLRGVDDFQVDTEEKGHWYPDPSLPGSVTNQQVNGQPAPFNLYNLNPFVWFVHKKLGLSGYGFSLDDDAADVGADGASELKVVIGDIDTLPESQFYHAEWTHGAPYGPVQSSGGTLSVVPSGQYAGMYQLNGLDTSPKPIVFQVLGVGSSGEPGALVSGPGITPGTRVYFANIGGNGVILDTPATIPGTPSGPYYFTGTPPRVSIPASAAAVAGQNAAWSLSVLGSDRFYGESSLTYTWSLLSGPTGGTASFSQNATNGAKNTVATVNNVSGKYVFQVTISEPANVGGFFTTSTVAVTETQSALLRRSDVG